MRIARIAATAVLSVATLCIAAATAQGEPAVTTPGISGVDRGVGYSIALAPDRSAVTTTLTAGHFELAGNTVEIIAPTGRPSRHCRWRIRPPIAVSKSYPLSAVTAPH